MLTRARATALAAAALTLAGCSSVHPGSAAVVDGETISMATLDRAARAYCALTVDAAQQQGISTVSNAEVRRQAVVALVSIIVARDLVRSEGLTIAPTEYELTPAQREQVTTAFPDEDADELTRVIEDSQEVSAIAVALAEKTTNQQATSENEAQFAELGQAAILDTFPDNDVRFAPRFGLGSDGQARAETGAIAVSPIDLEAPADEELPAALRCS